jgi:hypothetical protein
MLIWLIVNLWRGKIVRHMCTLHYKILKLFLCMLCHKI